MHGVSFKKRAPRAIKEIRKFATVAMVREYHVVAFLVHVFFLCLFWSTPPSFHITVFALRFSTRTDIVKLLPVSWEI